MSDPAIGVPASVSGDSTDVSTALDVASALWEKGSADESIRWLRRAVEAAGEAGNPARADELAGAVADLERLVVDRAAAAASKPPPAPPPTVSRPSMPAPASGLVRSAPPPLPARSSAPAPAPSRAPAGAGATAMARPHSSVVAALPTVPPAAFSVPAGTTIRVSVKGSSRDPDLLIVRPLPEGHPAPPGTREGTLVIAEDPALEREESHGPKNGSAVS
jgi:hypothetical protein